MISVAEAEKIILDHKLDIACIKVPLDQALGHILAEDLRADRDFPPYDRVTMDGIAINYKTFAQGVRTFPIEAIGPAGASKLLVCRIREIVLRL